MRRAGGKTAGKDTEKENKFNLFTVTVLCCVGFSTMPSISPFLKALPLYTDK